MTNSPIFCFDMDGTIADLYGVENWLPMIRAYDATPYREAKPLLNLSALARQLNAAQRKGAKLVIISWCSKTSTPEFDMMVELAKREWLAEHLPSVVWDEINVVPYGTNKANVCGANCEDFFLFDDEERNRDEWEELDGLAFNPSDISEILKRFNQGK